MDQNSLNRVTPHQFHNLNFSIYIDQINWTKQQLKLIRTHNVGSTVISVIIFTINLNAVKFEILIDGFFNFRIQFCSFDSLTAIVHMQISNLVKN